MSNDGGPAFPFASNDGHCLNDSGMSLRDYFAAKAMQGLLVSTYTPKAGTFEGWERSLAHESYRVADAMLAARARP